MSATGAADPVAKARDFLTRVLPWPSDDQQQYINFHYAGVIDGRKWMTGKPTNSLPQFTQNVYEALRWATPVDIYMCLSRQREKRTKPDGTIRAAKSQENATALKAIWLDVGSRPERGRN
jgi:hypothetical protein